MDKFSIDLTIRNKIQIITELNWVNDRIYDSIKNTTEDNAEIYRTAMSEINKIINIIRDIK